MANSGTVVIAHGKTGSVRRADIMFTVTAGGVARLENAFHIDGVILGVGYKYLDADTGLDFILEQTDVFLSGLYYRSDVGAVTATVQVTAAALVLTVDGNVSTLNFATYPTLAQLVTAIAAIATYGGNWIVTQAGAGTLYTLGMQVVASGDALGASKTFQLVGNIVPVLTGGGLSNMGTASKYVVNGGVGAGMAGAVNVDFAQGGASKLGMMSIFYR